MVFMNVSEYLAQFMASIFAVNLVNIRVLVVSLEKELLTVTLDGMSG